VRSICGTKVGATHGNDGKHTKGGVDYNRRNLIRGGSVVGYRLLIQRLRNFNQSVLNRNNFHKECKITK